MCLDSCAHRWKMYRISCDRVCCQHFTREATVSHRWSTVWFRYTKTKKLKTSSHKDVQQWPKALLSRCQCNSLCNHVNSLTLSCIIHCMDKMSARAYAQCWNSPWCTRLACLPERWPMMTVTTPDRMYPAKLVPFGESIRYQFFTYFLKYMSEIRFRKRFSHQSVCTSFWKYRSMYYGGYITFHILLAFAVQLPGLSEGKTSFV